MDIKQAKEIILKMEQKLNIGDEVNIKATVVDWNNGFGTVKLKINGLQEDNVSEKEVYIRMDIDEL